MRDLTSSLRLTLIWLGIGTFAIIYWVAFFQPPLVAIYLSLLFMIVAALWFIPRLFSQLRSEHGALLKRVASLEKKLRADRRIIRGLADGIDVAILICNQRGIVQYANRAAKDLFQVKDPVRRALSAITVSTEVNTVFKEALSSQRRVESEVTFKLPDEVPTVVQVWADRSEPDRVFVTVHDMSRLRHLERVRQDFVANVSHELRTPLTTIRALAETLDDSPPPEFIELGHDYLSRIISEVDRLTAITTDLLTLAHAESRTAPRERLDFAQTVSEVLGDFEPAAKQKGLELTYTAEPCEIVGNRDQLTQVVLNLLDNALKYTPRGTIQVQLSSSGGYAKLTVRDTGIGIPVDDQQRIFERFYRVDKGRSRESGGTGLGLSIVRHIIEQHEGTCVVDSILGLGTTFRVEIPLAAEENSRIEYGSVGV